MQWIYTVINQPTSVAGDVFMVYVNSAAIRVRRCARKRHQVCVEKLPSATPMTTEAVGDAVSSIASK